MIDKRIIHRVAAKLMRYSGEKALGIAAAIEKQSYLSSDEKKILEENSKYRGQFRGNRAFILGNGPSLDKVDLNLLKGEKVFVVNGFSAHKIIDLWQPISLTLVDPTYFKYPDIYRSEFKMMRERLNLCEYFLPLQYRDVVMRNNLLPAERCKYIHLSGNMANHKRFNIDITRPIPSGQTVTLVALLVSLYMGCNPVYLLGVDSDFLASPSKPTHFGGYEPGVDADAKRQIGYESWQYLDVINAVSLMFQGYSNIRDVASKNNYKIYNATPGGFLDIFERVRFDSLF